MGKAMTAGNRNVTSRHHQAGYPTIHVRRHRLGATWLQTYPPGSYRKSKAGVGGECGSSGRPRAVSALRDGVRTDLMLASICA